MGFVVIRTERISKRERKKRKRTHAERTKEEIVSNECYDGCGDDEVANLVGITGMKLVTTCERNIDLETDCKGQKWKLDFEYTARDTPQQNRLAQMGIYELCCKARAMMSRALVPQVYRMMMKERKGVKEKKKEKKERNEENNNNN